MKPILYGILSIGNCKNFAANFFIIIFDEKLIKKLAANEANFIRYFIYR